MSKRSKEYIAFIGQEYTIEWYIDDRGRMPALEYFEELDEARVKRGEYYD